MANHPGVPDRSLWNDRAEALLKSFHGSSTNSERSKDDWRQTIRKSIDRLQEKKRGVAAGVVGKSKTKKRQHDSQVSVGHVGERDRGSALEEAIAFYEYVLKMDPGNLTCGISRGEDKAAETFLTKGQPSSPDDAVGKSSGCADDAGRSTLMQSSAKKARRSESGDKGATCPRVFSASSSSNMVLSRPTVKATYMNRAKLVGNGRSIMDECGEQETEEESEENKRPIKEDVPTAAVVVGGGDPRSDETNEQPTDSDKSSKSKSKKRKERTKSTSKSAVEFSETGLETTAETIKADLSQGDSESHSGKTATSKSTRPPKATKKDGKWNYRHPDGRFRSSGSKDVDDADDEDSFLAMHNDLCEVCSSGGEVLCCSTCNLVFHLECARPVLKTLPPDTWSCAHCDATGVTGYKRESRARRRAASAVREMARMADEIKASREKKEHGALAKSEKKEREVLDKSEKKEREVLPKPENRSKEPVTVSTGAPQEVVSSASAPCSGGKSTLMKQDEQKEQVPGVADTQGEGDSMTRNTKAKKRDRDVEDEIPAYLLPRTKRVRRQPTLYDPQMCSASEWQSDGMLEWRYLGSELGNTTGDESEDAEDAEDDDAKNERQQEHNKNSDVSKRTSGKTAKTASQGGCQYCNDDESVEICCFCACRVCYGKHDKERTLLCDRCDGEYHTFCLTPPLASVPEDDHWFCPECSAKESTRLDVPSAESHAGNSRRRGRPPKGKGKSAGKKRRSEAVGTANEEEVINVKTDDQDKTSGRRGSRVPRISKGSQDTNEEVDDTTGGPSISRPSTRASSAAASHSLSTRSTGRIGAGSSIATTKVSPKSRPTSPAPTSSSVPSADATQKRVNKTIKAKSASQPADAERPDNVDNAKTPLTTDDDKSSASKKGNSAAKPTLADDDDRSLLKEDKSLTETASSAKKIKTAAPSTSPVSTPSSKRRPMRPASTEVACNASTPEESVIPDASTTKTSSAVSESTTEKSPTLSAHFDSPQRKENEECRSQTGSQTGLMKEPGAGKGISPPPLTTNPSKVESAGGKVIPKVAAASQSGVPQSKPAATGGSSGPQSVSSSVGLAIATKEKKTESSSVEVRNAAKEKRSDPSGSKPDAPGANVSREGAPKLQRSRSGRMVKRSTFHDEIEEGEQHLRMGRSTSSSTPPSSGGADSSRKETKPFASAHQIQAKQTSVEKTKSSSHEKQRKSSTLPTIEKPKSANQQDKSTVPTKAKTMADASVSKVTATQPVAAKVKAPPQKATTTVPSATSKTTTAPKLAETPAVKTSSNPTQADLPQKRTTEKTVDEKHEVSPLKLVPVVAQGPAIPPQPQPVSATQVTKIVNDRSLVESKAKASPVKSAETVKNATVHLMPAAKPPNHACNAVSGKATRVVPLPPATTVTKKQIQPLQSVPPATVVAPTQLVQPVKSAPSSVAAVRTVVPVGTAATGSNSGVVGPASPSKVVSSRLSPSTSTATSTSILPSKAPVATLPRTTTDLTAPPHAVQAPKVGVATSSVAAKDSDGKTPCASTPKVPRRKPGARECMQISRRFGVNVIPDKYMEILLDYCTRGKVEHLIRMRERLDEHSRMLEYQLAGLECLVLEKGELDVTIPIEDMVQTKNDDDHVDEVQSDVATADRAISHATGAGLSPAQSAPAASLWSKPQQQAAPITAPANVVTKTVHTSGNQGGARTQDSASAKPPQFSPP